MHARSFGMASSMQPWGKKGTNLANSLGPTLMILLWNDANKLKNTITIFRFFFLLLGCDAKKNAAVTVFIVSNMFILVDVKSRFSHFIIFYFYPFQVSNS